VSLFPRHRRITDQGETVERQRMQLHVWPGATLVLAFESEGSITLGLGSKRAQGFGHLVCLHASEDADRAKVVAVEALGQSP